MVQILGNFLGCLSLSCELAQRQVAERVVGALCMLPDTGERYLSTPLFDGIEAEMDANEVALSRSTPGFQFPS